MPSSTNLESLPPNTSWSNEHGANFGGYTLTLTPTHIQEIEAALNSFKSLHLDVDHVTRSTFPLPTLAPELYREAQAIHGERSYSLVQGIDTSRYTPLESTIIYLGIASYVADQRGVQDKKGNVLSHITNSKLWTVPENKRHGIHSNKALPFHNDMGCDILALQARHSANKGGGTYLSSVRDVYGYLSTHEPEVAKILTTPDWPVQTSGQDSLYYLAPAFTSHDGHLISSLDPNRFGRHPNSPADTPIPNLTPAQRHALDRVSAVAHEHEVRLDLQTGDLLFFNNWALLHRRDAYTDDASTSRHLVRLWLRNTELGWNVPDGMRVPWEAAYGAEARAKEKVYALEPMKQYEVPKYSAGSAAFVLED